MPGRPRSSRIASGRKPAAASNARRPWLTISNSWPIASSNQPIVSATSILSSTISTRSACAGPSCGVACADADAVSASGRRTVKVAPRPTPSLAATISPPCSSTRRRASARPMPSPLRAFSACGSTCVNMPNTRASISGARPTPLSATSTNALSPSARSRSASVPPCGVYLAALLSRLLMTCASRVASAFTNSGASPDSNANLWRPASITGWLSSIACCAISRRSTSPRRNSILPRLMRETSIRSSINRTRWASWRSIIARTCAALAESGLAASAPRPLASGASGLRNSCARMARNSSLRASAS